MRKTGMGRELRKESIACRPCSLNFDDKLLREVPDFCAAQRLSCLFAFYHEICVYVFEFLKEKHIKIWHFRNVPLPRDVIIKS